VLSPDGVDVMADTIAFHATVYKVQTLADGGVRVYLDLPETAIMQMAQLAECQRFGVVLDATCKPLTEGNQKVGDIVTL
jgi:hypothetical protein